MVPVKGRLQFSCQPVKCPSIAPEIETKPESLRQAQWVILEKAGRRAHFECWSGRGFGAALRKSKAKMCEKDRAKRRAESKGNSSKPAGKIFF
ncbi:hypothetical protein [Cronobacter sakazakii]|uniref:hypothetical protein n=1 Tax=Cronobacter sakazakii TaxID=28141 RepID=UPI001EF87B05|nr:hypothetical protein [Cronobacter sakazakii]